MLRLTVANSDDVNDEEINRLHDPSLAYETAALRCLCAIHVYFVTYFNRIIFSWHLSVQDVLLFFSIKLEFPFIVVQKMYG